MMSDTADAANFAEWRNRIISYLRSQLPEASAIVSISAHEERIEGRIKRLFTFQYKDSTSTLKQRLDLAKSGLVVLEARASTLRAIIARLESALSTGETAAAVKDDLINILEQGEKTLGQEKENQG
jgi:hypothetical protein